MQVAARTCNKDLLEDSGWAGVSVDRFVYAFLIFSEKICLIDCGVTNPKNAIFHY